MRGLVLILMLFPALLFAQNVDRDPYAVGNPDQDPPVAVKQGVIKVRRPSRHPYFKCEYYLTLSRVRQVEVLVPAANGNPGEMERDLVPVFDSSYSEANERVFPRKNVHFSRQLVEDVQYAYPFGDTTSIDTLIVQMWIGKNGKIRWRDVDTTYDSAMPRMLELEIYMAVNRMTEWGEGGGYMTPKKFLRKQKRIAENYYCLMYIIASAKPLTAEQKATDAHYAPFDIPLNSPPNNKQQKDFIDRETPKDTLSRR